MSCAVSVLFCRVKWRGGRKELEPEAAMTLLDRPSIESLEVNDCD